MKKLFLISAAVLTIGSITAQPLVSPVPPLLNKKGVEILPRMGDWSIGIDATPIIDLVGNAMKINSGSTFNNPANFNMPDDFSIYGKYFTADNRAIRARVGLGLNKKIQTSLEMKDGQSDPNVTVEDKYTMNNTNIQIVVGQEFRKGSTRLQGFYGYQGGINIGGNSSVYTYGNDYSTSNANPNNKNWGSNIDVGTGTSTLSAKSAKTFGLLFGGFAGVEYFIMPKFSIGGELSSGLSLSTTGKGKTTTQRWDAPNSKVEETERETGGGSNLGLGNSSGSLYMNFYF